MSTKVRIELGKILNFLHENQLNETKTALNNEIKKENYNRMRRRKQIKNA